MSKETHPGEAQTSVGTPDYMEKARELADSYPQLLARKQELKRQIDESHAWFYTRDEVIYKLSQGAHEQGERVKQAVRPTRWNAPSSTATRYWHL